MDFTTFTAHMTRELTVGLLLAAVVGVVRPGRAGRHTELKILDPKHLS